MSQFFKFILGFMIVLVLLGAGSAICSLINGGSTSTEGPQPTATTANLASSPLKPTSAKLRNVPTPTKPFTRTPRPTPIPRGGWETFSYVDNLTGESKTGVGLTAVWSSETSSIFEKQPARFILGCHRDGGLVGFFVWPGAYIVGDLLKGITDDNDLPVEYLLDGELYTDWWRSSGDE